MQREPKDRGTEANPEVKPNCGSLVSVLFPPAVATMTQKTETERGGIWSFCLAYTALHGNLQSYLLYHLHCRIAVDCCLTSPLLWI